jgi:hypothetical protein
LCSKTKRNTHVKLNINKMSKMKLNFATRVNAVISAKSDNNQFNAERAKVQAMVNANPVRIDRSVFQKTDVERAELASAKLRWKRSLK